jgi:AhpC/TSA family
LPRLQQIYQRYRDRGFTVLAVETSNRPGLARDFVRSVGLQFPVVIDDRRLSGGVYGVRATPTNIFIDPTGVARYANAGFSPQWEPAIDATIEELLPR